MSNTSSAPEATTARPVPAFGQRQLLSQVESDMTIAQAKILADIYPALRSGESARYRLSQIATKHGTVASKLQPVILSLVDDEWIIREGQPQGHAKLHPEFQEDQLFAIRRGNEKLDLYPDIHLETIPEDAELTDEVRVYSIMEIVALIEGSHPGEPPTPARTKSAAPSADKKTPADEDDEEEETETDPEILEAARKHMLAACPGFHHQPDRTNLRRGREQLLENMAALDWSERVHNVANRRFKKVRKQNEELLRKYDAAIEASEKLLEF